jgi:hypothetical protein
MAVAPGVEIRPRIRPAVRAAAAAAAAPRRRGRPERPAGPACGAHRVGAHSERRHCKQAPCQGKDQRLAPHSRGDRTDLRKDSNRPPDKQCPERMSRHRHSLLGFERMHNRVRDHSTQRRKLKWFHRFLPDPPIHPDHRGRRSPGPRYCRGPDGAPAAMRNKRQRRSDGALGDRQRHQQVSRGAPPRRTGRMAPETTVHPHRTSRVRRWQQRRRQQEKVRTATRQFVGSFCYSS